MGRGAQGQTSAWHAQQARSVGARDATRTAAWAVTASQPAAKCRAKKREAVWMIPSSAATAPTSVKTAADQSAKLALRAKLDGGASATKKAAWVAIAQQHAASPPVALKALVLQAHPNANAAAAVI